jgi:hypothetical protein
MLDVLVCIVFAAGLVALGVSYWDQRQLLARALAEKEALVEHIQRAATTGRRDVAAAYTDLINAVQFHMPAGGGSNVPPPPRLRPPPTDVELWLAEQQEQSKASGPQDPDINGD